MTCCIWQLRVEWFAEEDKLHEKCPARGTTPTGQAFKFSSLDPTCYYDDEI